MQCLRKDYFEWKRSAGLVYNYKDEWYTLRIVKFLNNKIGLTFNWQFQTSQWT